MTQANSSVTRTPGTLVANYGARDSSSRRLGYFVDIYDLILFSIVRVTSLRSLGVSEDQILGQGVLLLNMQMGGMLVGGIVWGILGDRRGRLSVLFGSIIMYSVANIANGFVSSVPIYAALRFIAGVGLAGELGAGITLVSEVMPAASRGYGTMVVATVGILGAVVASLVGRLLRLARGLLSWAAGWASHCWYCASAWRNRACSRACVMRPTSPL